MDRQKRAGFSLTELLIVILIIAILIALLMPALASAWYTAYTTECKTHLATIYKASVTFQNDKGRVMFPFGDGWVAALLPYVEYNQAVFTCPAALPPKMPAGAGTSSGGGGTGSSTGGTGSGGGTPGSSYDDTPDAPWSADDPPPNTPYCQFAFDVYNGKNTGLDPYLWTVTVTSEWSRAVRTGPNTWHYMIEDMGWCSGGDRDYNDIDCEVTYKDGLPTQVKIIQGETAARGYYINGYGDDLTINGVVAVRKIDDHIGLIVPLVGTPDGVAPPASGVGQGTPGGATSGTGDSGSPTFYYQLPTGLDPAKLANYGLNKGTYDVANLNITKPDTKLIYILDHHELVVDAFADFDKYFIQDPAVWNTMPWAKDAGDWHEYQCLRHFSKANVLFCDGHIESLGYWDLDPVNPAARSLWRVSGN